MFGLREPLFLPLFDGANDGTESLRDRDAAISLNEHLVDVDYVE